MKQTGKRLFAVLLTIALCLSLFPVMASAEEAAEPVSIASLDEITDMNGSYKLARQAGNDVRFSVCPWELLYTRNGRDKPDIKSEV